jgi:hypothetical protein
MLRTIGTGSVLIPDTLLYYIFMDISTLRTGMRAVLSSIPSQSEEWYVLYHYSAIPFFREHFDCPSLIIRGRIACKIIP